VYIVGDKVMRKDRNLSLYPRYTLSQEKVSYSIQSIALNYAYGDYPTSILAKVQNGTGVPCKGAKAQKMAHTLIFSAILLQLAISGLKIAIRINFS